MLAAWLVDQVTPPFTSLRSPCVTVVSPSDSDNKMSLLEKTKAIVDAEAKIADLTVKIEELTAASARLVGWQLCEAYLSASISVNCFKI